MTTEDIQKSKDTYQILAFVHNKIVNSTQYYLEEVDVAKAAAKLLTDMCNKMSEDIEKAEAVLTESQGE